MSNLAKLALIAGMTMVNNPFGIPPHIPNGNICNGKGNETKPINEEKKAKKQDFGKKKLSRKERKDKNK